MILVIWTSEILAHLLNKLLSCVHSFHSFVVLRVMNYISIVLYCIELVTQMGDRVCTENFMGKCLQNEPLAGPRIRWKINVKMNRTEVGCDSWRWIELTEDHGVIGSAAWAPDI
jgi:hypothetical protein